MRAGRRRKACGGGGGAAGPQGEEPLEALHRGPAGLHVPGSDLEAQSHRSAACPTWPHPCLEGGSDELTQSLSVLLLCVNLLENWFQSFLPQREAQVFCVPQNVLLKSMFAIWKSKVCSHP